MGCVHWWGQKRLWIRFFWLLNFLRNEPVNWVCSDNLPIRYILNFSWTYKQMHFDALYITDIQSDRPQFFLFYLLCKDTKTMLWICDIVGSETLFSLQLSSGSSCFSGPNLVLCMLLVKISPFQIPERGIPFRSHFLLCHIALLQGFVISVSFLYISLEWKQWQFMPDGHSGGLWCLQNSLNH